MAVTPASLLFGQLNNITVVDILGGLTSVSGTGAISQVTTSGGANSMSRGNMLQLSTGATAASLATAQIAPGITEADTGNIPVDFSKVVGFGLNLSPDYFSSDGTPTNAVFRATIGFATTANSALTNRCVGFEVRGSASARRLWLVGHNGTTAFAVDSSVDIAGGVRIYNLVVVSDGTGNITLYKNGSSIATSASGPTANESAFTNFQVSLTNGASAQSANYQVHQAVRLRLQ